MAACGCHTRGLFMQTTRLTVAQALVEFLDNQYLEVDGKEIKFVHGIAAIFGHGNVLGVGQTLAQCAGKLTLYQGRNEQGMAHLAIGFAKQNLRQKIIACTSSVGPECGKYGYCRSNGGSKHSAFIVTR